MTRGVCTKTKKQDFSKEICSQIGLPIQPEWDSSGSTVTGKCLESILIKLSDTTGIPPNHFQYHEKYIHKLLHKSIEGMLLALEIINKPSISYRLECFLFLLLNSWELLIKAKIISNSKTVDSIKDTTSDNRTITFEKSVREIFPLSSDPIHKNLFLIEELRNEAMHLFISVVPPNALPLFQASILNYENCIEEWFNRSLSEKIPYGMMFLVSEIDPSQFTLNSPILKKYLSQETIDALSNWQEKVKTALDDLDDENIGKFAMPITINLSLVKNPKKADVIAEFDKLDDIKNGKTVLVAERRINELDYYSFGLRKMANKIGISAPKTTAYVKFLQLHNDPACFKIISVDKSKFPRYSNKAVERIIAAMKTNSPSEVWKWYMNNR